MRSDGSPPRITQQGLTGSATCYGRSLRIKMDSALNTPFSDWGNILFNTTIATAIADRLVENSEVFLLGGRAFASPKIPVRRPRNRSAGSEEAPRCDDNPAGGVRRLTPQRRC